MTPKKTTVMVVDDDPRMLRMMERILNLEKYEVLKAATGEAALEMLDEQRPDLLLLDVMMPGLDGYEVCRRIREFSDMPIIMVTAKSGDEEKVSGFDAGADDYITKPFSSREFVARIRAVLRRTADFGDYHGPVFRCGALTLDFGRHVVILGDKEISVTATEYNLLSYLAHNAGRVLTPDQILGKVWAEGYAGETHLLQVTMARLRDKLGDDPKNPRYITTKHGVGYMMSKE